MVLTEFDRHFANFVDIGIIFLFLFGAMWTEMKQICPIFLNDKNYLS